MMDPFLWRFYGGDAGERMPRSHGESATGSGVIISPDGYIIINNHVVEQAGEIHITLSDRREFKSRLRGADPNTGIGAVRIDAAGPPALAFADRSKVRAGDFSIAVGNPF
jgi:serine protease Do